MRVEGGLSKLEGASDRGYVTVYFRTERDDMRAWNLVSPDVPYVGLDHRGMVADITMLRFLRAERIPVYSRPGRGERWYLRRHRIDLNGSFNLERKQK